MIVAQRIKKFWKEFNINVPELLEDLKALNSKICGISIDGTELDYFWIDCEEQLTQDELIAVDALWDDIDEISSVALNYVPESVLAAAEMRAREDAAMKAWDNLTTEQKKMLAQVPLTHTDREHLLIDFPES